MILNRSVTALIGLLILVSGCKKETADHTDGLTEEQVAVVELISEIPDRAGRSGFEDLFVKDPGASERKKYQGFAFGAETAEISGNTATAQVEILKYGEAEPTATKTWKFTKSGEGWKIESAPL